MLVSASLSRHQLRHRRQDTSRMDHKMAKSTFSSKTDKDATKMFEFLAASELIIEMDRMFSVQTVRGIVKHLSSLGPVYTC